MTTRDTKWITTALALCTASTGPQLLALSLLMPDITQALDATVPQLGQLNTAFSIVALVGSFIMGAVTVRYPPKRLLLAGVATLFIGVIVASRSTSYEQMIFSFILYGIGNSLVPYTLPTTRKNQGTREDIFRKKSYQYPRNPNNRVFNNSLWLENRISRIRGTSNPSSYNPCFNTNP